MAGLSLMFTNYGLSELASAPSGGYVAPQWLVIDTTHGIINGAGTIPVGATSIATSANVSQAGDTQLCLSVGTPNQEVVTFTGSPVYSSGLNTWTYTLSSPTTQAHTPGDIVVRQPKVTDDIPNIASEMQVDPTYLPNQRALTSGGYNNGTGIWVMQMYMTGVQANGFLAIVGLADSVTIGQGHLHAVGVLGTDHSFANGGSTSDLEIDVVITLTNG